MNPLWKLFRFLAPTRRVPGRAPLDADWVLRELMPLRGRLFLVLGVPRSGTTLLCSKLASHSRTVCLDEPFLHWHRFRSFPLPGKAVPLLGFAEPISQQPPGQVLARLGTSLPLVGIKETFRGDAYWPGFGNDRLLSRVTAEVTGEKTVAILRNPLSVWNSVRNRRLARTGAADKAVSSRFTANWNGFARWVRSSGVFVVRYEDLVRDPQAAFAAVCGRLGVPFEPAMLEADAAGKPEKPGHPSTRGVFATSERKFDTELPERDLAYIRDHCATEMRHAGYEC